MKFLLWACIICVAFAKKKHFHFLGENRHANPSMDLPYPIPENDFTPPGSPSETNLPKNNLPGNPYTDPRTAYPYAPSSPRAPLQQMSPYPIPTWLDAPFRKASSLLHASNRPAGHSVQSNVVNSITYVPKPPTTPQLPVAKFAIPPALTRPNEPEPAPITRVPNTHATRDPRSTTSLDQIKK
ncbi:proline-rich protein 27 [Molossus nigricans]